MLKFLVLLAGTIFISSVISYFTLKTIVMDNNKQHLENSIDIMIYNFNEMEDLDSYALNINDSTGLRVTIIDSSGIVIAESNTDKKDMDNHSSREEILQANEIEYSSSVRYSDTMKVYFLYVAKKSVHKGKDIYIRLSMNLGELMEDFYSLWVKLVIIFIFILVIAFYISKKMSAQIVFDIEQITKYLNEISNKNYNAVIKTKYFYEFLQISLMLKNLVKKLSNRDKQKRKYTAKLRLINKQRNDIISAISHEFKNPIASIIGYSQTIQEDENINPSIRNKFLGKISANGEKISQMLDRLALSVKLENNDLDIKETEFDLKLLCEDVVANLLLKYRDRKIIINVESMLICADKTMIELVVINLLDNALKYSQDNVEVILTGDVLSVIDSGIGIKPEHIDQVTSKFYRVKKNTWDNSMGIGLAMVSYILKAHKSSLDISSEYTKSSKFSFSTENMIKK